MILPLNERERERTRENEKKKVGDVGGWRKTAEGQRAREREKGGTVH